MGFMLAVYVRAAVVTEAKDVSGINIVFRPEGPVLPAQAVRLGGQR